MRGLLSFRGRASLNSKVISPNDSRIPSVGFFVSAGCPRCGEIEIRLLFRKIYPARNLAGRAVEKKARRRTSPVKTSRPCFNTTAFEQSVVTAFKIMPAYEQNRCVRYAPPHPFCRGIFYLELGITDRQHLVHDQNLPVPGAPPRQMPAAHFYMPLEYRFTGVSRNASTSENATISSNFFLISSRLIPRIAPFKKMFSRPVNSW